MIHTLHLLVRAERPQDSHTPPLIGHVTEHVDEDGTALAVDIEEFGMPVVRAPEGYVIGLRSARFSASGNNGRPPVIRLLRIAEGHVAGDWWWLEDEALGAGQASEIFVRTDALADEYPYAEMGVHFFRDWAGLEPRDGDEADLREIRAEDLTLERGLMDESGRADA